MSSLLQFSGIVDHRGVGLLFYVTYDGSLLSPSRETFPCNRCVRLHETLYRAFRRPVGMLGCWVQFRYNGKIHAPDLSLPIPVAEVPLGATRLNETEAIAYWHSS